MTPTAPEIPEAPSAPPPREELHCGKCGAVLAGEKDRYWHDRRDSVGCIRTLLGMVLDLHSRLEAIEGVFERAAASSSAEEPAKGVQP